MTIRVVIEVGRKRSFASALDWPGWARAERTPTDALATLVRYGDRYACVAERAGLSFSVPTSVDDVHVVEELEGGSTTDFGAPEATAALERAPIEPRDVEPLVSLLEAAWATFDDTVAAAANATLRAGPRGGGRSVEKIVDHVVDAEKAYLAKLGSRRPSPADDPRALRGAFLATLVARVRNEPLPNPARTTLLWAPRYAVRRAAWHVLDHAWEVEDRSGAA